ncbi:hypothetical protein CCZ01_08105 [Helicobacter monodelphidis]|uniref:methyltransferase domain-containing protein n=1 Tax=Helicobacter sp. 15-1451 TaxID=2004995 RepID=UPI000DCB0F47|nr:methyltransferase domain-containing protein [Helicobacter sp. 15-1451]RAX56893.1 hypothetical protein CCZ01_08105 [Helicobacter sp. 15-1451]
MGFYKEDYKILESLKYQRGGGQYYSQLSVCEFGSQDLLEDIDGNVVPPAENGRWHAAKKAYEEFGITNYECIDLEGVHNALRFDLGLDLKTHYQYDKQFDIVTCKDIGHWVFDQKQLFTNIHNLCKKDGIIIWRSAIGGGFAQGCFAIHHYKILQLAFSNRYLLLDGYLTEYLHDIHQKGKFPDFDRKEATKIDTLPGDGFVPRVEAYAAREDSWRYLPLSKGLPSISATLVFKKQEDTPFNPPLFYYAPNAEVVKRNAKSVLQNCLPLIQKGRVAVFGAGEAGGLAAIFLKECGVEVACFIDEYQKGQKDGLPILSVQEFIQTKQSDCDFILKGPCQKGGDNLGTQIPVKSLYYYWFVG